MPLTSDTRPEAPIADARAELPGLIAEQGVGDTATFDVLFGKGADLWADDGEFARFLEGSAATRAEPA